MWNLWACAGICSADAQVAHSLHASNYCNVKDEALCKLDLVELFHMIPPQLKFGVDSIAAGGHTVCIRPSCQSRTGVAAASRQGIHLMR